MSLVAIGFDALVVDLARRFEQMSGIHEAASSTNSSNNFRGPDMGVRIYATWGA